MIPPSGSRTNPVSTFANAHLIYPVKVGDA